MYTKKDDNDIKQMAQNRKKGCAISAQEKKGQFASRVPGIR